MSVLRRRQLLVAMALALLRRTASKAGIIQGHLPWVPDSASPPLAVRPGPWRFFTPEEARLVEALADRVIPPDPQTPGGREAGCVVFIDRQLAGPYGRSAGLYTLGPFRKGTPQQGPQDPLTPAQIYRTGLAALERFCRTSQSGAPNGSRSFAALAPDAQDSLLRALEEGRVQLEGADGKQFFALVVKDVQEGFFADPIYGGNRDMCGWKMIGFPGARYDYRDWVSRHNERYPHPPVSIAGRRAWTPRNR